MYEAVWKSFQSEIGSIEKIKSRGSIVWQGKGIKVSLGLNCIWGVLVGWLFEKFGILPFSEKATFLGGKQIL